MVIVTVTVLELPLAVVKVTVPLYVCPAVRPARLTLIVAGSVPPAGIFPLAGAMESQVVFAFAVKAEAPVPPFESVTAAEFPLPPRLTLPLSTVIAPPLAVAAADAAAVVAAGVVAFGVVAVAAMVGVVAGVADFVGVTVFVGTGVTRGVGVSLGICVTRAVGATTVLRWVPTTLAITLLAGCVPIGVGVVAPVTAEPEIAVVVPALGGRGAVVIVGPALACQ